MIGAHFQTSKPDENYTVLEDADAVSPNTTNFTRTKKHTLASAHLGRIGTSVRADLPALSQPCKRFSDVGDIVRS